MKTAMRSGAAAVFGLLALAAQERALAEVMVGGGAGISQLSEYGDVDDGTAWRAFVGYRDSNLPIYVEAQYFDSGELDVDDFEGINNITIEFDGYAAAIGYRAVLDRQGSDLVLKAGGYTQDTRADTSIGSVKDDGGGALIGVGGNWMFAPNFGLHFDVQILFGVQDLAEEEDLTIATLGLVYSFFLE